MALTARRWRNKQQWADSKTDGPWSSVRAFDADDLATWLDDAPATDAWIASILGEDPENLESLTAWWESWTRSTSPRLDGRIVLAGREQATAAFLDALDATGAALVLASDSMQEGIAFVAAALGTRSTVADEQRLAQAILVHNRAGWVRAISSPRPRVLMPMFEGADIAAALAAGHGVIVLTSRSRAAGDSVLDIGRIRREAAREVLSEMGFSVADAERLASVVRGSLLSLWRTLAIAGTVQTPAWARGEAEQALLPVVLAGTWHDESDGDREVMARLAAAPYEQFIRQVARWDQETDPPVRSVGSTWRVVSPEDSWRLLMGQITAEDMRRFEEVCHDLFNAADPTLELAADERWLAAVRGVTRPHSESLRRGLATTLAFIGARFENSVPGGRTGQDIASHVVRGILSSANDDPTGKLWISNSDVLLQLTEAAPEVFLDAVDRATTGDAPVMAALFADSRDANPLFTSSAHTGLLWALEALAWSREHLSRVTRILARLSRIDPGGTLSNRPRSSLVEIYLPWHPQTTASLQERFEVIDSLLEREPTEMRSLLIDLLPSGHEVAIGTQLPLWREWATQPEGVTRSEWIEAIELICDRLLRISATDQSVFIDLVPHVDDLPRGTRDQVLSGLASLDSESVAPAIRSAIAEVVRAEAARHRRFPQARWVMPTEDIERLERIYQHLAPDNPVETSAWLFGHHPDLPQDEERDWEQYSRDVDAARREAISVVFQRGGVASIAELGDRVESPGEVGRSLGALGVPPEHENEIFIWLDPNRGSLRWVARGYTNGRFGELGWEWVSQTLEAGMNVWLPGQLSEFLLSLPATGAAWDWVSRLPHPVSLLYWQELQPMALPDPAESERAARELMAHGRPFAALDLLGLYVDRVDPPPDADLVALAMETAATSPSEENIGQMLQYHVARLLDHLEGTNALEEARLAQLEWLYLPLLRYSDRPPRLLHRQLERDPLFLADVVCQVFRGEGEEREVTPESRTRAQVGHQLLDSWNGIPGVDEEGGLDGDALYEWVQSVRQILHERNRQAIGDQCIGNVLRYSPDGVDGVWPHEAVRRLIEDLESQHIETGIEVEVSNSRGFTSRGVFEGGDQERQLSQQYQASAESLQTRWPRTAAMLRRIADHYEWAARRHDDDAERYEDG